MTKETYRDQGLSRRLIEEILKDYQGKVDMIFLFTNETVLEFYPKFGFSRVMEDSYLLNVSDNKGQLDQWQLVNSSDNQVAIKEKLSKRFFDEDLLHTLDSQALELFYYSTACKELVYFNQLADVYMIFEIEGDMLHIYDMLGIYDVHLLDLVNSLPLKEVSEVVFHFPINTRLYPEIVVKKEVNDEDVLFVLGDIFDVKNIKIPLLNHA